jgi:zinc transport system substrate-binding protein
MKPVEPQGQKISIAATFYPLAFLAEQIGGEFVTVIQITPGGIEPHDYEPTPQQLAAVHDADVFLINGAGIDPWAEALNDELASEGVMTVNIANALEIVEASEEHDDEYGYEVDPHFWLNPVFLQTQAELVRDALSELDPAHENDYRGNERRLITELSRLDQAFRSGLAQCEDNTIIVSHDAFGYMADEYGFETTAVAGLSPEEEPSSGRIAEIADIAKRENIKYIFFETLVSPKLAETIADEIGAQTLVLNPIEGLTPDDEAQGKNYFSIMRENLQNLRTAMQCR